MVRHHTADEAFEDLFQGWSWGRFRVLADVVCIHRIDLGKRCPSVADIQLADDHIGDQAGSVFAEQSRLPFDHPAACGVTPNGFPVPELILLMSIVVGLG